MAGRLVSYTNRAGQLKTIAYNLAGQPVAETWGAAPAAAAGVSPVLANSVSYTYDDAGRVTRMDNGAAKLSYAHDKSGRVISEISDLSGVLPGLSPQTVSYRYDRLGRRAAIVYPDGSSVAYGYDARGRLITIDDGGRGRPLASYTYDPLGRVANLTRDNGVVSSYQYDMAGQLTDIEHAKGRQALASAHYELDLLGRRVAQTREDNLKESYTHDASSQLTGVDYGNGAAEEFSYDAVGNRIRTTAKGLQNFPAATTYTANNLNQYLQVNGAAFQYDSNGNLTYDGRFNYTYDSQNRLVTVESANATAGLSRNAIRAEFFYDARNRCVLRRYCTQSPQGQWVFSQTDSRTLAYDTSWNLVCERTLDGLQAGKYVHGQRTDDILQWTRSDGAKLYPLADGVESIVALSDARGHVAQRYRYAAYGLPIVLTADYRAQASDLGYRFLFTGREWINSVGLNDHRYRYYSPQLGRWTSTDPIGFGGGLNLYSYIANNPLNRIDPLGLMGRNPCCGTAGMYNPGTQCCVGGNTIVNRQRNYEAMGFESAGACASAVFDESEAILLAGGAITGGGAIIGIDSPLWARWSGLVGGAIAVGSFGNYLVGYSLCSDYAPCQ